MLMAASGINDLQSDKAKFFPWFHSGFLCTLSWCLNLRALLISLLLFNRCQVANIFSPSAFSSNLGEKTVSHEYGYRSLLVPCLYLHLSLAVQRVSWEIYIIQFTTGSTTAERQLHRRLKIQMGVWIKDWLVGVCQCSVCQRAYYSPSIIEARIFSRVKIFGNEKAGITLLTRNDIKPEGPSGAAR